jgi:hypothetical protein
MVDSVGSSLGWVVTTQHVPRFRALLTRGKTPMSCLVLYYELMVGTMVLLELYCLEEEEDLVSDHFGSDPPIVRVQDPLYRQGPIYMFRLGCPAAGFAVAVTLASSLFSCSACMVQGRFIK